MIKCACGGNFDPIDHVILVVGWTPQYFIARNQWGTSWGVNGYVYLPRNSAYPSGYPKTGQCNMLSGPIVLNDVSPIASSAPVTTASPVVTATPTQYPSTTRAPVTTRSPFTTLTPTPLPTVTNAPVLTRPPALVRHRKPHKPHGKKSRFSTAKPSTTNSPHTTATPSTATPATATCSGAEPLECVVPNMNNFCCPYVCFFDPYNGREYCTDVVCCTNGACAQFAGFQARNPMISCPSNGRRALHSQDAETVRILQSLVSHADQPL